MKNEEVKPTETPVEDNANAQLPTEEPYAPKYKMWEHNNKINSTVMLPCSTKGPMKGKTRSFGYIYTSNMKILLGLRYKRRINIRLFAKKRYLFSI